MTTRIMTAAIIRSKDEFDAQMAVVRAEIMRQNAGRAFEDMEQMCADIRANTERMEQLRESRNRLLADRLAAKRRPEGHRVKWLLRDALTALGRPLLVGWALFWLACERLGLCRLGRGQGAKPVRSTPLFDTIYFAVSTAVSLYVWIGLIYKISAWVRYWRGM